MPQYLPGSLGARGLPPRRRRPQPIPEDGSQHGPSSPSDSSIGANNVRRPFDYGDSQSESNIPISPTVMPDRHKSLPDNRHITPHHPQYYERKSLSNASQSRQPFSSPPEGPSSQNTLNSHCPAGDQIPAGAIDSAVYTSRNTQRFSCPSTQEQHQPCIDNQLLPRAVTWNNSGYQGFVADSQSNSPRRNSEREIPQPTSHQSIPQENLERNEYGSNQTISNRNPSADNYQAMQSKAEDPQAFDTHAGMNTRPVYEGENASYTASSNERLNKRLSAASRTTTRSRSINSMSSAYSSPVSDENGPSSRPLNGLNDPVSPTGVALRRSQQEYNTGMTADVGFDFSPLLSQLTLLICEAGKFFLMGCRGPAE